MSNTFHFMQVFEHIFNFKGQKVISECKTIYKPYETWFVQNYNAPKK